jgi:hypothetical protein
MDGEVLTINNYFPFAVCRISQGNLAIDRQFTGQILDSTGLYYYNARYYNQLETMGTVGLIGMLRIPTEVI